MRKTPQLPNLSDLPSDPRDLAPRFIHAPATRVAPITLGDAPFCNERHPADLKIGDYRCMIFPDKIVTYKLQQPSTPDLETQEKQIKNLTRGIYNGYLSRSTATRIRKILHTWIGSIQHYRENNKKKFQRSKAYSTFATLTLPISQHHSDIEIKRHCLTPFIKMMKERHKINYYFWKAEAQLNGNIHFHLIFDRYVYWEDLRIAWNNALDHLGYTDLYCKMLDHHPSDHYLSTGSTQAPTTHIKRTPKNSSTIGYMLKYCAKSPRKIRSVMGKKGERTSTFTFYQPSKKADGSVEFICVRRIEGRLWGCSDRIRNLKPLTISLPSKLHVELDLAVKYGEARTFTIDFCTIYYLESKEFLERVSPIINSFYLDHFVEVFNNIYYADLPRIKPPIEHLNQIAA